MGCAVPPIRNEGVGASNPSLTHLARDVAYGVEASGDLVLLRLQLWLGSVFSLAERVTDMAASTHSAKRRALERRLSEILTAPSRCDLTHDLQAKIGRARDQHLVFLDHPGRVAVTNNGCERALRSAVVQRKVTNGYQAMWVAAGEADVRTVVDAARLSGANTYATLLTTIRV